jgi:hypothetical protein
MAMMDMEHQLNLGTHSHRAIGSRISRSKDLILDRVPCTAVTIPITLVINTISKDT